MFLISSLKSLMLRSARVRRKKTEKHLQADGLYKITLSGANR